MIPNTEAKNEYLRKWRADNPEKRRHWRRSEKGQQYQRIWELRTKYGLTVADYERMFAEQGGRCAICGTESPGAHKKHFAVDHCHKTGRVRGLLCSPCNTNLGWFERRAARVAEYLK